MLLIIKWTGIILCLFQSGIFSGLNLGFFGLSRLRLEVQAETGNNDAKRILDLRKDSHLLLTTLLWGNVASNVLLTLVSESVMAGVAAFVFSTFGITFLGEIIPQAYLSKSALKSSGILVPIVKFYKVLLFPVAKPAALLLDVWLGKEEISFFTEKEVKHLLKRHGASHLSDVEALESQGASNFLSLDDVKAGDEGEIIDPLSIVTLPLGNDKIPIFPKFAKELKDPFLQKIQVSKQKWVIIADLNENPVLILDSDQFLRDVLYDKVKDIKILPYCHKPILVRDSEIRLASIINKFKVCAEHNTDDVIDNDVILVWGDKRKIITGSDILGKLLEGISQKFSNGSPQCDL